MAGNPETYPCCGQWLKLRATTYQAASGGQSRRTGRGRFSNRLDQTAPGDTIGRASQRSTSPRRPIGRQLRSGVTCCRTGSRELWCRWSWMGPNCSTSAIRLPARRWGSIPSNRRSAGTMNLPPDASRLRGGHPMRRAQLVRRGSSTFRVGSRAVGMLAFSPGTRPARRICGWRAIRCPAITGPRVIAGQRRMVGRFPNTSRGVKLQP